MILVPAAAERNIKNAAERSEHVVQGLLIVMDFPKIPGYEILEALPRGGMSVVFKACQLLNFKNLTS